MNSIELQSLKGGESVVWDTEFMKANNHSIFYTNLIKYAVNPRISEPLKIIRKGYSDFISIKYYSDNAFGVFSIIVNTAAINLKKPLYPDE